MIGIHIISKILVQYPIDFFSLAINLWAEGCIELKLGPDFLHKKCLKFWHELGILITYNDLGHAMMSYPHVENNVAIFAMVVVVLVVLNLANFENLCTTIKIVSFFSNKRRHIIKSIKILSNGLFGIGRGLYNPYFFLCINFVPWHLTHVWT